MTTPRIDWTSIRPNGPYLNFQGVTAENLTLVDRGGSSNVVAVDKPNDYRIKLFAQTQENIGEEESQIRVQMKDSFVSFTRMTGELLQAQLANRDEMMRIVYQTGNAVGNAQELSVPEFAGLIDVCLEGRFNIELGTNEHGAIRGDFGDYPEWLGDDAKVYMTPANSEAGGGPVVYISCPSVNRRILNRVRHFRVNGYWMPYMPLNESMTSLYLVPDPRDAEMIRNYDGETIPNGTPLMRDRTNLRSFFYRFISGANRGRNWSSEAANIYGPWRNAILQDEKYIGLGISYGQWKLYEEKVQRGLASAANHRSAANKIYAKRPAAFTNYTLEEFALETAGDKKFGSTAVFLAKEQRHKEQAATARQFANEAFDNRPAEYASSTTVEEFAEAAKTDDYYRVVSEWLAAAMQHDLDAESARTSAMQKYSERTAAYSSYTIEAFAEETKNNKSYGVVSRMLTNAKQSDIYAQKSKAIADPMKVQLDETYIEYDANNEILGNYQDQYDTEIRAYFTV